MPFKDLDTTLFAGSKDLPVGGKTYSFPGTVSARTGLILHRMSLRAENAREQIEAGADVDLDEDLFDGLDDDQWHDMRAEVLGDAQFDLIDDGVSEVVVEHVLHTLIVWHQFGEEVAQKVWEDVPGAPKAPQDRQPKKAAGSGTNKGSRGGTGTQSKRAAASSGATSSTTDSGSS